MPPSPHITITSTITITITPTLRHPHLSDIDLVVTNVPKPPDNTGWMSSRSQAASNNPVTLLEHQLKTQSWVSSVNALPNASVPIIKIQVGVLNVQRISKRIYYRSIHSNRRPPPAPAAHAPIIPAAPAAPATSAAPTTRPLRCPPRSAIVA